MSMRSLFGLALLLSWTIKMNEEVHELHGDGPDLMPSFLVIVLKIEKWKVSLVREQEL